MFDIPKYKQLLGTQWLGHSVLYFDELESTNSHLKHLPAGEVAHGLICLTDKQTCGRGQYERDWESEEGKNLTVTLAFKPSRGDRFHVLTLACVKASADLLKDHLGLAACIKWPNDLMVDGKKVGGFLTETVFFGSRPDRVLVGVGLNLNQEKFSENLQEKACSLKQLTGKPVEREHFLCKLLSRIEYEYGRWLKNSTSLLKEINTHIDGYGKWVTLNINGTLRKEKSKLVGIDEDGRLVVIDEDGTIEKFAYEQIRLITD